MNLSDPVRSLGTLSLIDLARRHAERLANHDDDAVRARAVPVGGAIAELEAAYAKRRPLRALRVQATHAKDLADAALDDLIRTISYEILAPGVLGGDRRHPDYRVLFPAGNIGFIEGPDREALVQVRAMVSCLADRPGHPAAGRIAALTAAADALEATLDRSSAAGADWWGAVEAERAARVALRRALRRSLAFLRHRLDGDERAVEALFPPIASAREEAGTPEPGEAG